MLCCFFRNAVPFLLSSHKKKCFCKYVEDVRNDNLYNIYKYDAAPQDVQPFLGDVGHKEVEQSQGLGGGGVGLWGKGMMAG